MRFSCCFLDCAGVSGKYVHFFIIFCATLVGCCISITSAVGYVFFLFVLGSMVSLWYCNLCIILLQNL